MDESGDFKNQNKSDTEGQRLHLLPHIWNLELKK
jgi:hypothetical protein